MRRASDELVQVVEVRGDDDLLLARLVFAYDREKEQRTLWRLPSTATELRVEVVSLRTGERV